MSAGSELRALVGRGTQFEGRLVFEQRARIEGRLRGEVWGEGILVLGEGADVEGTIQVGTLIVRAGVLRGEVTARELIEVHPDAKVYANITAPIVDLAKGCVFEGRCAMTGAPPADDATGAPAEAVSTPARSST